MASKREALLEYLKTLLAGVTVANGYNFTLATIARGIRNIQDFGDSEFPAVFITMTHEKRTRITSNQFKSDLQVILIGYVKNTKGDVGGSGTGIELDLDKLVADITKAVETDPLQGGRVYNTEITDIATDDGDLTPNAGVVLSVVFSYASEGITP